MSKNRNLWVEHASALGDAYVLAAGSIRFELVTRAIVASMPSQPQRIVDVGGGYGQQAIMLARKGHSVSIVDCDANMLAVAQTALLKEGQSVRERVRMFLGEGESATEIVGQDFDLACCHSVLMYQDDPAPMLRTLVRLVRSGGLISVLSTNTEASAMRCGLQGRWREAAANLQGETPVDSRCLPSREHRREDVIRILQAANASIKGWHGVGVFTDHLTETIYSDDPAEIYLAEWLAGNRDPYRLVARCFHLLAQRN